MAIKFKVAETIINDFPFLMFIAIAGIGYIGLKRYMVCLLNKFYINLYF